MSYDYKTSKQTVENILNSSVEVKESISIPKHGSSWTFDNGIKSWVTAVFVDLRNSTELFRENDVKVAKIIRAYTSEIIDIMKDLDTMVEIGIRGDAVYGIYSTPNKKDDSDIFSICCRINTYMKMLNKLLDIKGYNTIRAGIGMASSQDLIVKVGKKHTGVNDRVWIGKSLAEADRLSKITNVKKSYGFTMPMAICKTVYRNIKDIDDNESHLKFDSHYDCYKSNTILENFNNWINKGMII